MVIDYIKNSYKIILSKIIIKLFKFYNSKFILYLSIIIEKYFTGIEHRSKNNGFIDIFIDNFVDNNLFKLPELINFNDLKICTFFYRKCNLQRL